MSEGPRPLLTVIVPTIGRATLAGTLESIRSQAPASAVEILVVVDTAEPPIVEDAERITRLAEELDCRVIEHGTEEHCWGHPQRDEGARRASGAWLWWLQDDDTAAPGAIWSIFASLEADTRSVPRLFRTLTWQAGVVWREPGRLAQGEIDADCIVAPNDPARLPRWGRRYNGDWDFIDEAAATYGGPGRVIWEPALIALGRPGGS